MTAAVDVIEQTRRSWNHATRNHNAHKGDQAQFLRTGGELLFDEELTLLGPLAGQRLVHMQCNAGQDSLCLARRGAIVTGVDLSDEAIAFAQQLAADTGIAASFERSELVDWLHHTPARFDLAFSSYGAAGWLPDLAAWAKGIARVLVPGGRFVYVEFHPIIWSFDGDRLAKDDYFATQPFREPVTDYVAESGAGLGVVALAPTTPNPHVAVSYQHTLSQVVTALVRAGLRLTTLEEYPYANGYKALPMLQCDAQRRWQFPAGMPRIPLMFGLAVEKAR